MNKRFLAMRGEISSSHPIERKAGPLPARRSHHPAPFVPTPVLFIAQSSRFGAFTLLIVAAVIF